MHIYNRGADSLFLKKLGGSQGSGNHQSAGDDANVGSLSHHISLAGDEGGVGGGQIIADRSCNTDVNRSVDLGSCHNSLLRLSGIAGNENGHMGHLSHQSDILDGLMASAVLAYGQSGVGETKLHIAVGVGNGVTDLLKRASSSKQGEGAGKRNVSGVSEAGGRAHHICLSNTHVEMTIREFLLKHAGLGGVSQVSVQNHYFIILLT